MILLKMCSILSLLITNSIISVNPSYLEEIIISDII